MSKPESKRQPSDWNYNPTGKGGFGDHPEHRSPGGWRKEVSISYQYKRFLAMSQTQLEEWDKNTPPESRLTAEALAYNRVVEAKDSLPDIKEITDRTEGKAVQSVEANINGEIPVSIVRFFDEADRDTDTA